MTGACHGLQLESCWYASSEVAFECQEFVACGVACAGGTGRVVSYPGVGIRKCALACDTREGCTSFEYIVGDDRSYECATYVAGAGGPSGGGGLLRSGMKRERCVREGAGARRGAQDGQSRTSTRLSTLGIVAVLASVCLAVAVAVLLYKNHQLRKANAASAGTELGGLQQPAAGGTQRVPGGGGSLLENLRARVQREPVGMQRLTDADADGAEVE